MSKSKKGIVIAAETKETITAMDDATFAQWLANFDKPILPANEPLVVMNDETFKQWLATLENVNLTTETIAAMDDAAFNQWLADLEQASKQFKTAAQTFRAQTKEQRT